jgi:hypothetical protein
VRDSAGVTSLHADANAANSALFHRLDQDVRGVTLRWRWRVERHPLGANTQVRSGDDRPIAVFVMVRRSLFPWRTRGLIYQWAAGESCGVWRRSPYARDIWVMTLANAAAGPRWREESRELGVDLAQAFGAAPDRVEAIGVLCDADDTKDRSIAEIAEIRLDWSDPLQP